MKPLTRKEFFMAKAAGQSVPDLEPITREEYFLNQIAESGGGGGGLPAITEGDEGKVLTVDEGAAVWAEGGGGGGDIVFISDDEGVLAASFNQLLAYAKGNKLVILFQSGVDYAFMSFLTLVSYQEGQYSASFNSTDGPILFVANDPDANMVAD